MGISALAVLICWLCISLSARGWSWHSALRCGSTWERCAQGRAKTFPESYKAAPPLSVIPSTNTRREQSCLPSQFQFLRTFCWGILCSHVYPVMPCLCPLSSPLSSKMMGFFPFSTPLIFCSADFSRAVALGSAFRQYQPFSLWKCYWAIYLQDKSLIFHMHLVTIRLKYLACSMLCPQFYSASCSISRVCAKAGFVF